LADINPILELMEKLRDKDKGCPWDIKQDHNSIAHCSIEEAYELVAAITKNDQENIKEELGDLLLQVIFHSQIAKENNTFDFNNVVEVLSKKLITRHPNVFDPDFDLKISADEQSKLWDEIKEKEKKQNTNKASFESISSSLSPIQKSKEIQKEASKKNFDWDSAEDVFEKVYEELNELKSIQHKKDQAKEELGDLFFILINLAKHLQIDPDIAIESANQKFMRRFLKLEEIAKKRNQNIENANIDDLDELWEEVKRGEKSL
jgi:MazG family protein